MVAQDVEILEQATYEALTNRSSIYYVYRSAAYDEKKPLQISRFAQCLSTILRDIDKSKHAAELQKLLASSTNWSQLAKFSLQAELFDHSLNASISKAIEQMKFNEGCLEFNPFRKPTVAELESGNLSSAHATFIGIHPGYTSSPFLQNDVSSESFNYDFRRRLRRMLSLHFYFSQLEQPTFFEDDSAVLIEQIIFELYSNIRLHACEDVPVQSARRNYANFWFIRIQTYTGSDVARLSNLFSECFDLYFEKYLFPRWETGRQKHVRLTAVTIQDNGHGILRHYKRKKRILEDADDRAIFENLISKSFSSSGYGGAGKGIPRVMRAVKDIGGVVSLRSNGYWFLSHAGETGTFDDRLIRGRQHPLPDLDGTSYTMLFPSFAPNSR